MDDHINATSYGVARQPTTLRDEVEQILNGPDGEAAAKRLIAAKAAELAEALKYISERQRIQAPEWPYNPYVPLEPFPHPDTSSPRPWPPDYPSTLILTTDPWRYLTRVLDFVVTDPPPNLTGGLSLPIDGHLELNETSSEATIRSTVFGKRFRSFDRIGVSITDAGCIAVH